MTYGNKLRRKNPPYDGWWVKPEILHSFPIKYDPVLADGRKCNLEVTFQWPPRFGGTDSNLYERIRVISTSVFNRTFQCFNDVPSFTNTELLIEEEIADIQTEFKIPVMDLHVTILTAPPARTRNKTEAPSHRVPIGYIDEE